ncbi:glycoside hydrolase family 38 C-terminal domain-containing protein [Lacrimispora sp.]|uniref:glycoside hydrolase family 38 C-terminal domain-containing protein n=1 Tax=Lacrimispora sp. TaxID=2719234 RepID=UPI0028A0B8CE|nr:glycoside hydrolase family 38 C-terminal domain-containing protein [Lacrimispora sp.]
MLWNFSSFDRNDLVYVQETREGNFEDRPMRYDAWDIDMFYMQKMEMAVVREAPRLVENSEVRAVIRFSYSYRNSFIQQDMVLYAGSVKKKV